MSKQLLDKAFKETLDAKEKIFVPYIMAGDGGLDVLEERIKFLQDCGATAIEIGIPFSDPVADGPVIQEAGKRSLANGTTLSTVLETLESFKARRTVPVIVMTYLNPVYTFGVDAFATHCKRSGVDGVIIPDLPLEEEELMTKSLRDNSIAFIRLVALTSPRERRLEIAKRTKGFLYAVSVTGTTGVRVTHSEKVKAYLQTLKENCSAPVLAGFGVSSPKQARDLASHCDGVVVGSKIVDLFHQGKTNEIRDLIQSSFKVQA